MNVMVWFQIFLTSLTIDLQ